MKWGIKPETKIKETSKCQDLIDLSFENSLKIKYIKISDLTAATSSALKSKCSVQD